MIGEWNATKTYPTRAAKLLREAAELITVAADVVARYGEKTDLYEISQVIYDQANRISNAHRSNPR